MTLAEKIKEKILSHAVEASAASITVLLGWAFSEITPILLPYIEAAATKKLLLSLFGLSLLLNLMLLALVWFLSRGSQLRLKYGIYWDRSKNPHCPSCKTPLAAYGHYQTGRSYYCKACKKPFPLADATGRHMNPTDVLNEL
jgi:hypothetical protein